MPSDVLHNHVFRYYPQLVVVLPASGDASVLIFG